MNLKRVVPNLIEWTSTEGEGYDDLEEIYGELVYQWRRYAGHVTTNIGGVYQHRKASDQEGPVYSPVSADYQKKAMTFLNDYVFTTPDWLLDEEILSRIEHAGALSRIKGLQSSLLGQILNPAVLTRLSEQNELDPDNSYNIYAMLEDLRKGIWSELYASGSNNIDAFRRNLQREYLSTIQVHFEEDEFGGGFRGPSIDIKDSDIRPALRYELTELRKDVNSKISNRTNAETRAHLKDVLNRIDDILNEDE